MQSHFKVDGENLLQTSEKRAAAAHFTFHT